MNLDEVPWLLARFAPHYLRHLVRRPYRARAGAGLATRHRTAVYDAVLDLMLRGYADLAGHPLRPDTGTVAVLFTRIGFAFDDEYERRATAGEPLSFEDVFDSPPVRDRLSAWRAYMSGVDTYPAVRDFLAGFVRDLYTDYRRTEAGSLDGAVLDSGGLLAALAHVVGRLHGRPPPDRVIAQFTSLGVAAKLADDILDLPADLASGSPNLVHGLVGDVPLPRRVSARWLRREHPAAHAWIATEYARHEAALTSAWLRYACRLMWTPALIGHRRATETRGRI